MKTLFEMATTEGWTAVMYQVRALALRPWLAHCTPQHEAGMCSRRAGVMSKPSRTLHDSML